MADIFISYKREDGAVCAAFAEALAANGYTVWFDRDIREGDSWDRTIEREIGSASAVLVLWSRRSRESDWVRNEARFAKQANRLLPVRIEHCELPLEFAAIQTVDAFDLPTFLGSPGWSRLLDRIDAMVGRTRPGVVHGVEPAVAEPVPGPAPQPAPNPHPNRPLLLVIALLLGVIAVGIAGMASYLRQPQAAAEEAAPQTSATPASTGIPAPEADGPVPAPIPPPSNPAPSATATTTAPPIAAAEEESADVTPCETAEFQIAAQPVFLAQYSVHFEPGSARLNRAAAQVVREAASRYLDGSGAIVVRVIGERRRRQAVREMLIAQGLPEHRVSAGAPLCGQDRAQRALEVRIWLGN